MPTVLTHAAVGLAIAVALRPPKAPPRLFALATLLPVVPDLDTWVFGAGHASAFSHRGATHSLLFAGVLAAATVLLAFPKEARASPRRGVALGALLFLAIASHGLMDAFTNGGSGVMLLWPFDEGRIFWSFRPIEVAPLSVRGFFTARGLAVFQSELRWVWLPAAALVVAAEAARRALRPAR